MSTPPAELDRAPKDLSAAATWIKCQVAMKVSVKRLLRVLGLTVLAGWLFGAYHFLRADGHMFWQVPRSMEAPRGEHNLAFYAYGPRIRASSYVRDVGASYHPAFVLDGVATPSEIERWKSDPRDRAPWLEVSWKEERRLARVVLRHAGAAESGQPPAIAYRLTCLTTANARAVVLDVPKNEDAIAQHEFRCASARGIRIDWRLLSRDDSVSLYEIEVWGQ